MNKTKQCGTCGETKPVSSFYKQKDADGYFRRCIACCALAGKERSKRINSDPKALAAEQAKARERYHKNDYKNKYWKNKKMIKEKSQRHRAKYPEKYAATNRTRIIRQKGHRPLQIHLHHWSYKPEHRKDFIELFVRDHATAHRFLVYDQNSMLYRTDTGILLDTKEAHFNYIKGKIDIGK